MKKNQKILITLTGLIMSTVHIINRLECVSCISKNRLSSHQDQYYQWRFGNIRYQVQGHGSPLLLIHDLTPGSSSYEFSRIIPELTEKYTVYTIDLPGYGLSDKPNMTYTNYLFVQLITDFIKKVIGKKTSIVATGNSAVNAIMAVHNDAEYFHKLILISPQNLYEGNQIPSKQTRLFKCMIDTPILGTFIYNLYTNRTSFETKFRYEYFHQPVDHMDDIIDAYLESAHVGNCNGKYAYSSFLSKYGNMNMIHALKEINNSILMISGKEYSATDMNEGNYTYFNRSIETERISGSKLLPQFENPADTVNAIRSFLYDD